jgi:hypothetical protein
MSESDWVMAGIYLMELVGGTLLMSVLSRRGLNKATKEAGR